MAGTTPHVIPAAPGWWALYGRNYDERRAVAAWLVSDGQGSGVQAEPMVATDSGRLVQASSLPGYVSFRAPHDDTGDVRVRGLEDGLETLSADIHALVKELGLVRTSMPTDLTVQMAGATASQSHVPTYAQDDEVGSGFGRLSFDERRLLAVGFAVVAVATFVLGIWVRGLF